MRIVIVGGGLAGATAAAELRTLGFAGDVIVIGAEPHEPYERPPLTKTLLRGETTPCDARVHPDAFYEEHDVELRLGCPVERIARSAREVHLAGGAHVGYDRLLLATGADAQRLVAPGAQLDGVLTLRTIDDALLLHDLLGPGLRLVVVGGGWIGCEIAASAVQSGADVCLIEAGPTPLGGVLGPDMGAFFADLHRDHGVHLITGVGVAAFHGTAGVTGVELADGRRIPCDVAVVGVGVRPAVRLAQEAGLSVTDGIDVDAFLRTSDPEIYAAGDVASVEHARYGRLRVEHWDNARRQGQATAAAMLDRAEPFDAIPYFFSDQYELGMEYTGRAAADDQLVIRGDVSSCEFIAFWLREGRVTAGMNVNVWDVADGIQALISDDVPVVVDRLADPGVALTDVVAARR